MSFKNRSAASIKSQSEDNKKCGSHVFTDQELTLIINENDEEESDLSFLGDYKKIIQNKCYIITDIKMF